ncbi:hypothetical protein ACZ76_15890 [Yersinia aleksiciae]|uniref:Tail fiber protein n=1 Tax=Yersinia aleksiciae TaxID=263819 RepID=A0ABM5UGE3_YERAE|nr:hypothetical protein ACZ76_15890 [Yersinia aleksiciae]CFQ51890.1 tail fiber protein [Yersinia aleksiciae]
MQKIGDIPNTRADINGEFTDGNVAGGVPPTILPAEWFNTLQRELINVVQDGGLTLDPNDDTQILAALKKLFLQSDNNLSEIKAAGPTAIAAAQDNLGLSDAAHLPQLTGIVGTSRNARMSIATASATAIFTADELIVQAALGGRQYKLANFNKTINLSSTGAGGMDVGAAPASGYVALYAIYNPATQVSALLAVNATLVAASEIYGGVNMPAGYTASALISVWGTSSSQFKIGYQFDRHITIVTTNIYTTTSGTTVQTSINLASAIPLNTNSVDMLLVVGQTVSGSGVGLNLYSSSNGIGQIGVTASVSGQTSSGSISGTMPVIEAQKFYFAMNNTATGQYYINCRGYDF